MELKYCKVRVIGECQHGITNSGYEWANLSVVLTEDTERPSSVVCRLRDELAEEIANKEAEEGGNKVLNGHYNAVVTFKTYLFTDKEGNERYGNDITCTRLTPSV